MQEYSPIASTLHRGVNCYMGNSRWIWVRSVCEYHIPNELLEMCRPEYLTRIKDFQYIPVCEDIPSFVELKTKSSRRLNAKQAIVMHEERVKREMEKYVLAYY